MPHPAPTRPAPTHPGRAMRGRPQAACLLLALCLGLLPGEPPQASNRWDLLRWCEGGDAADVGRCEATLRAALELTTHDDFRPMPTPPDAAAHTGAEGSAGATAALCFPPELNLLQLRDRVIEWLRRHPIAEQRSALGLSQRALKEQFACREATAKQ